MVAFAFSTLNPPPWFPASLAAITPPVIRTSPFPSARIPPPLPDVRFPAITPPVIWIRLSEDRTPPPPALFPSESSPHPTIYPPFIIRED